MHHRAKSPLNYWAYLLFFLSMLLSFLSIVTEAIFCPTLPHIAFSFEIHPQGLHGSLKIFYFITGLSILFHGYFVDRVGCAFGLFSAQTFFMAGSLLCATSASSAQFQMGSFILSIGIGATFLISRVLVQKLFEKNYLLSFLSLLGALQLFIPPLAPLLSAEFLAVYPWQVFFVIGLSIGLMAFILSEQIWLFNLIADLKDSKRQIWEIQHFSNPAFTVTAFIAFLHAFEIGIYQEIVSMVPDLSVQTLFFILPALGIFLSSCLYLLLQHQERIHLVAHPCFFLMILLVSLGLAASYLVFESFALFAVCSIILVMLHNIMLLHSFALLSTCGSPSGLCAALVSSVFHLVRGFLIVFEPYVFSDFFSSIVAFNTFASLLALPILLDILDRFKAQRLEK